MMKQNTDNVSFLERESDENLKTSPLFSPNFNFDPLAGMIISYLPSPFVLGTMSILSKHIKKVINDWYILEEIDFFVFDDPEKEKVEWKKTLKITDEKRMFFLRKLEDFLLKRNYKSRSLIIPLFVGKQICESESFLSFNFPHVKKMWFRSSNLKRIPLGIWKRNLELPTIIQILNSCPTLEVFQAEFCGIDKDFKLDEPVLLKHKRLRAFQLYHHERYSKVLYSILREEDVLSKIFEEFVIDLYEKCENLSVMELPPLRILKKRSGRLEKYLKSRYFLPNGRYIHTNKKFPLKSLSLVPFLEGVNMPEKLLIIEGLVYIMKGFEFKYDTTNEAFKDMKLNLELVTDIYSCYDYIVLFEICINGVFNCMYSINTDTSIHENEVTPPQSFEEDWLQHTIVLPFDPKDKIKKLYLNSIKVVNIINGPNSLKTFSRMWNKYYDIIQQEQNQQPTITNNDLDILEYNNKLPVIDDKIVVTLNFGEDIHKLRRKVFKSEIFTSFEGQLEWKLGVWFEYSSNRRLILIERFSQSKLIIPLNISLKLTFHYDNYDDISIPFVLQSSIHLFNKKHGQWGFYDIVPPKENVFENSITVNIIMEIPEPIITYSKNKEIHQNFYNNNIQLLPITEKLLIEFEIPNICCSYQTGIKSIKKKEIEQQKLHNDQRMRTLKLCGIEFTMEFGPLGCSFSELANRKEEETIEPFQKDKKCSISFTRLRLDGCKGLKCGINEKNRILKVFGRFRVSVLSEEEEENENRIIGFREVECDPNHRETMISDISRVNKERKNWSFVVEFQLDNLEWIEEKEEQEGEDN